ncbi:hypothetical protein CEG14_14540 [Bordetella genomosp. 1]|uniref:Uncharacterized protein n=1 Tax=Bordetella genomosp. 1 TaxID=1395607 RepID=A0A261SIS1_9BORD|nr:hypothetical protein [Bordetella genomosp. 1]OZI36233.1 hypothetical protein CEG14_14540 [Bordetella genomosp. 1]
MEPKNGDFAKYVEELSRKGARDALAGRPASASPSPGAVDTTPALPPDPADAPGVVLNQSKLRRVPALPAGRPTAAADADAANTQTLAQRADNVLKQRSSTVIGIIAAIVGVFFLSRTLDSGSHDFGPAVIVFIVSALAFRSAARARALAARPLREQSDFAPKPKPQARA